MRNYPKHLSRLPAQYAVWDHELVGSPYGGPAYGLQEKGGGIGKILGVVAAVAAVSTGWGMIGAGSTLQSLAGGAMVAGGVMQGVGTVTGNAKLAKLGGTLTLVGGLGSMAGDMKMFGGSGEIGSTMSKSFSESTVGKMVGGLTKGADVAKVSDTQTLTIGDSNAAAGGIADAAKAGTSSAAQAAAQPSWGSMTNTIPVGPTNTSLVGNNLTNGTNLSGMAGTTGPASSSGGGLLSQGMDLLNKNPGLAQIGGNIISGMAGGAATAEAQAKQAELQKDAWARQDAIRLQELANVNGGVVFINPNDPDAAAMEQAMKAAGKQTIRLGANQNAGPVTFNPNGQTPYNQAVTLQKQRPA